MIGFNSSIVITGGMGQLGSAVARRLAAQAIALDKQQLDLTRAESIEQLFHRYRPAAVINCGAYTLVDQAETEAEQCFTVNAAAVEVLANCCRQFDCVLVQISTDYVFGGEPLGRPWRESDMPSPSGVYARSKWAGEIAAAQCPKHFIVRTCGLYGGGPHRVSFVEKMLQLARTRSVLRVVHDQQCTPTYVNDLAEAIEFLLATTAYGTYHVTNAGDTNWHELATEIFRFSNLNIEVQPITSAEFGAPAIRPTFSVLDNSKYLRLQGPSLRPWRAALAEYLLQRRPALENDS